MLDKHIADDNASGTSLTSKYLEAATALTRSQHLTPRLKRITFECESLGVTVRQLVQQHVAAEGSRGGLSVDFNDLRCTAIGVYNLRIPNLSQEWRFSYSLLASLWDSWIQKKFPTDALLEAIQDYFGLHGPRQVPRWVYGTAESRLRAMHEHNVHGLAAQVALYSGVETTLPSLKPQKAQFDFLRRFALVGDWTIKPGVLQKCVEFAGRVKLKEVREDDDADILEWATELLAPNTRDFAADFGQSVEDAEKYVGGNQ